MNPVNVLAVIFAVIDAIHDYPINEWIEFLNNGVEDLVANLSVEEKFELKFKLDSLTIPMCTKEWHRRFNISCKLHELI